MIRLTYEKRYKQLKARESAFYDLGILKALNPDHAARNLKLLDISQGQLRQDIFVLSQLNFKRDGFFVEFGATNGRDLNNTYILEKEFGWSGILAEPDRRWHDALKAARSSKIDTRCVFDKTGETVKFTSAPAGENSGVSDYVPWRRRLRGGQYDVETISFNDLLVEHGAPEIVDYASIDTEGSEFLIMNALDFSRHQFRVLTIEHNWEPRRADMHALMSKHGYQRVHEEVSFFDDWYIHPDLVQS